MAKVGKKAVKLAEQNWNCLFAGKKWEELIPKEGVPSLEGLTMPKLGRPKSLSDPRPIKRQDSLKARTSACEVPLEPSLPSQVEFLYSLWDKAPKGNKRALQPIKSLTTPAPKEDLASIGLPQRSDTLQTNVSHSSTFYKINHSRNKVTKSYNYVVRKTNLQFVCKEKEAEQPRDPFSLPTVDEPAFVRPPASPPGITMSKIDIKIEGEVHIPALPAPELKSRPSIKAVKLAKIRRDSRLSQALSQD